MARSSWFTCFFGFARLSLSLNCFSSAAGRRAFLVRVSLSPSLVQADRDMERRALAVQRLALLALLLLALAVGCLAAQSSPTPQPSTRRVERTTAASALPSSSPFVSGATFTISSPEESVTPEQKAALEAALPACVRLPASDDGDEEGAALPTTTTIKTSSTTSAACG